MTNTNKLLPTFGIAALAVTAAAMPDVALAGSEGAAFDDVWDMLTGWIKGTLGQIIVLAMIIVGIVGGIARQSIMAFAVGVGGGIGLFQAPDVVESILSATAARTAEVGGKALEVAPAIAEVLERAAGTPHP